MKNNNVMSELVFKALELKVNQLIAVCKSLDERNKILEKENSALQEEKSTFRAERSRILQQKDLARDKVEAMITRLKSMES